MSLRRLSLSLFFAAALCLPHAGQAQQAKTDPPKAAAPKQLGVFGNWKAFAYGGDKPVCYMTMAVHFPANKKIKRADAYLMITHRPGENTKDVVSYTAGYSYKASSDVDVVIGKKTFNLFTQKDTAWSRDAATDHAIATAMRNNASLKITGTPGSKGVSAVSDTINLKGSGAAYDAISKACGYPVETPKPAAKKAPAKKAPATKKKTPSN